MPASYTSARFVGRDEAFARLAAVLDDAAGGRSRTILARRAPRASASPASSTRRRSGCRPRRADDRPARDGLAGGADEPYGPIVRAIGPTLRALPIDDLADRLGPAAPEVVRLLPDLGDRLEPSGGLDRRPERHRARAPPGPDAGGHPRHARAGSASDARSCSSSRTSTGPTPRPGRSSRSCPGSRATSAWRSSARTSRTSSRATTRGGRPRRDHVAARGRPTRLDLPPLDRDELAALIEGIEGERASASLLLLVAERSGGLPLVAEELLAARRELPSASLSGSFDDLVIARLAIRSRRVPAGAAADGAGRAAARPPSSSPTWPPPSRSTRTGRRRARSSGPRDGDGVPRRGPAGPVSRRPSATGSSSRATGRSRSATRRSAGPSSATCCRSPGRATTRPWRRRSAVRRRPSSGTGSRRTTRVPRGRPPSRPPRSPPRGTPPPTSWPRSSRAVAAGRARTGGRGASRRSGAVGPGRPPGPRLRGGLRRRAGSARATAYLEAAIGGLDARARPGPARASSTTAWRQVRRAARRPGRGDAGGPPRRRARPTRAEPRNGRRSSPGSPS